MDRQTLATLTDADLTARRRCLSAALDLARRCSEPEDPETRELLRDLEREAGRRAQR